MASPILSYIALDAAAAVTQLEAQENTYAAAVYMAELNAAMYELALRGEKPS